MRVSRALALASYVVGAWLSAFPVVAQQDLQPVPAMVGFIGDPTGVLPAAERERISGLLRKLNQD